jgi:hypothetical protein
VRKCTAKLPTKPTFLNLLTMKKTLFGAIAIISLFAACKGLTGRTDVSSLSAGTVSFDIAIAKGSEISPMMRAMIPSKGEYYFKGDVSSLQASTALVSLNVLTDGKNHTMTLITDNMMTGKTAMQATEADLRPQLDSTHIVAEQTTETKEILGITTTKIILRDTLKNTVSTLYMAQDAPVGNLYWQLPFGKIKGLVLEYEYKNKGVNVVCTATKITAAEPAAVLLELPKNTKVKAWKIIKDEN